tara:strand:+ start:532 stop:951 length:420 start_codon:yes stop_codon:yes gene_type:complete
MNPILEEMITDENLPTLIQRPWGCSQGYLHQVIYPDNIHDKWQHLPLCVFQDMYGTLLYEINPDFDDADLRKELVRRGIPGAEKFSAGRCFEMLAVMIAIEEFMRDMGHTPFSYYKGKRRATRPFCFDGADGGKTNAHV